MRNNSGHRHPVDPGVHPVIFRKAGKMARSRDKKPTARTGRKGGEASGDQQLADWLSRFDIEEDDDRKSSERERR